MDFHNFETFINELSLRNVPENPKIWDIQLVNKKRKFHNDQLKLEDVFYHKLKCVQQIC